MSPDGKRARLAEAEMAARLQDHLHLRDKTDLENIQEFKKKHANIHLAGPLRLVLLQELHWSVHRPGAPPADGSCGHRRLF